MGGGVESPQGTDTPRVAEFTQGGKTPGATTAGKGEPRRDRWRQGGDETPPITQATGAKGANDGNNEQMGGRGTVDPPRPQRGTSVDDQSAGTPSRHTPGTDGARTKNVMLARREYGYLAPTRPAADPANTGYPESAAGHGATGEQARQGGRDTEEGEKLGSARYQCAACKEIGMREGYPPNGRARLMHAATKGGERGGGARPAAHAHGAQPGIGEGPPKTAAQPPPQGQEQEGEGTSRPSSARNPRMGRRGHLK